MSCLPVVCFYLAKRAEDFPPPTDEVRREREREREKASGAAGKRCGLGTAEKGLAHSAAGLATLARAEVQCRWQGYEGRGVTELAKMATTTRLFAPLAPPSLPPSIARLIFMTHPRWMVR